MTDQNIQINSQADQFSHIDPNTLPEQLQGIYKNLVADYTRKRQEDSNRAKEAELRAKELEQQLQDTQARLQEYVQANEMWAEWGKQIAEINPLESVETEVPGLGAAEVRKRSEDERLTLLQKQELDNLRNQVAKLSTALDMYLQIDDLRHQYKDLDPKRVIDTAMELKIADLKKARDIAYREDDLKAEVERRVQEKIKELDEQRRTKVLDGGGSDAPFDLSTIVSKAETPLTFETATREILKEVSSNPETNFGSL